MDKHGLSIGIIGGLGLGLLLGREYIPFDFNNPIGSLSKLHRHLRILSNRKQTEYNEKLFLALLLLIGIIYESSKQRSKIKHQKKWGKIN